MLPLPPVVVQAYNPYHVVCKGRRIRDSKLLFSYLVSSWLAWATRDPISNQTKQAYFSEVEGDSFKSNLNFVEKL